MRVQPNSRMILSGKCYGYIRKVVDQETFEEYPLDFQKTEIKSYTDREKYILAHIYEEVIPSVVEDKLDDRPALITLLEALRTGDLLIVYTLPVLSKCTHEYLEIDKVIRDKKCAIVLIREQLDTANPYGIFTVTAMILQIQLQINLSKERKARLEKSTLNSNDNNQIPPCKDPHPANTDESFINIFRDELFRSDTSINNLIEFGDLRANRDGSAEPLDDQEEKLDIIAKVWKRTHAIWKDRIENNRDKEVNASGAKFPVLVLKFP
jgi:hypothetical protein